MESAQDAQRGGARRPASGPRGGRCDKSPGPTVDAASGGGPGRAGAPLDTLVSYCIDADDVVVSTGLDWDDFARTNDAPELCSLEDGRTLWSYIADDATRQVWRRLVQRTRTHDQPITVDFRCDAPDRRRWLTATLTADAGGGVEFVVRLVAEEGRAPVALLDERVVRDPRSPMVNVCAWCGRCGDDGDWIDIEIFMQHHEAFGRSTVPPITHGMCPSCEDTALAAL